MPDWLLALFNEDLMPHGFCIAWRPEILWLHVVSDALIVLAYYSIPLTLFHFVRRRRDVPYPWVFYLFSAFIFACGTTHALGVVTIWKAMYGVEGIMKAATAGISLATAGLLIPLTPRALALRSPEELEKLNEALEREIAERKGAERRLQEAYDRLEERVAERTAELARAKDSLEREMAERKRAEEERRRLDKKVQQKQRLESLGAMAGGVAHDFNNLLTVISGQAALLSKGLKDESALWQLDRIVHAATAAGELSRQLLTYSGGEPVETQPVDASDVIVRMKPLLDAAASGSAEVSYELADALPPVLADPAQFRQVVLNLVLNAAEALKGASGRIVVRTETASVPDERPATTEISFLDSSVSECVCLEVTDSGPGMDVETQQRIFDPFYSTKFTGRGLGLAVVLGIVKGCGGAVRITSHPGEGAGFRILLPPFAGARSTTKSSSAESLADSTGGETVLIVDDEENVRGFMQAALSASGYRVLSASGGREGLTLLEASADEIDLVLLDLAMPDIDGDEVLRRMRERGLKTKVVLCSGYAPNQGREALSGGDAAGFLGKPFTLDKLLAAVRGALSFRGPAT